MGNVYACLIKAGINITNWLKGSAGGGIARVRAYSKWTDPTTINYILIEVGTFTETVSSTYTTKITPGDNQRQIHLRKNAMSIKLDPWFVGNISVEEVRRLRNWIYYAKSENPKLTGKYFTLILLDADPDNDNNITTNEYGQEGTAIEHATDSSSWARWNNTNGFERIELNIKTYTIKLELNGNVEISSIITEVGNK